jgi:membrane protease YdiL (CAAX protease family)
VLIGVWALIRRFVPAARRLEAELARMLGRLDTAEVVALALLSGLAEEIFFRGAVQGALGWPLATLLFTVLHTGPGRSYRVWTLFAAIAGLLLAGLVAWRHTLLPAIVAHALVNGVNLRYLAAVEPSDVTS